MMATKTKRLILMLICIILSITSLVLSIASFSRTESGSKKKVSQETTIQPEPVNIPDENNNNTYEITDAERQCILEVLVGECIGESFIGQMAVAQCIRDTAEYYGIRPTEVIEQFKYFMGDASAVDEVKLSVLDLAIDNIFIKGARVVPSRIMFFYNPDKVTSKWHESQKYVITIDHHRFFDIKEK